MWLYGFKYDLCKTYSNAHSGGCFKSHKQRSPTSQFLPIRALVIFLVFSSLHKAAKQHTSLTSSVLCACSVLYLPCQIEYNSTFIQLPTYLLWHRPPLCTIYTYSAKTSNFSCKFVAVANILVNPFELLKFSDLTKYFINRII